MTKQYATKHGPNLRNTLDAIAEREPFNAGNLTGRRTPAGYGQMRPAPIDQFIDALTEHELNYVVMSYSTPIAWHDSRGWTIPADKHSTTTSAHQNLVRRAVAS